MAVTLVGIVRLIFVEPGICMHRMFPFLLILFGGFALNVPTVGAQTIFSESFNTPAESLRLHGDAAMDRLDAQGAFLYLPDQARAEITGVAIPAREGSITFWLRPMWDERDARSHTIFSARWDDGRQGYLAVSYGWWEPLGAKRLYFVVNNQQSMHCSAPYRFERDQWTFVVVSWSSGTSGRCAIYADDERVVEHRAPFHYGNFTSTGPWFIGSDRGATDQRQRSSEFAIDELRILDRALSDRDVRELYRAPGALPFTASRTEWEWMRKTLELPVHERRAADGTLLESRAVFDEDIQWAISKDAADRTLARVKSAGFNVYVPCVWHGRGTHYPSRVTDADSRLVGAIADGYDPLSYLIKRAHELGIEVHPWFTVVRREWERYPEFYPKGTPDGAYDVHNAQFRDFIVSMMLDMVERYDVDGVNLDYIRAMGICVSDACKEDYKKHSNYELPADYVLRYVSGAARNRIQAWQDSAVANIVERVASAARKSKPGIVISIDGHPKPPSEKRALDGRDEVTWANNGWVDVIFGMDYRKRFDDVTLDAARAHLSDPRKLHPLFGNYERIDNRVLPRASELITRYVQFARRKWPGSGVGFYILTQFSDEQVRALRAGVFRENARTAWPNVPQQPDPIAHRTVAHP